MSNKCEVVFVGIDSWNRPIFKDDKRNFYGAINKLFSRPASEVDVLMTVKSTDLTFFGSRFNCEPMGTHVNNIKILSSTSLEPTTKKE